MPPGVPPILLFRTFVKNLAIRSDGGVGPLRARNRLSLCNATSEIVTHIDACRCCDMNEQIDVNFANRVGFTSKQITSLTHGGFADPCWSSPRERVFIEVADSLHDGSRIDDGLWQRLSGSDSVDDPRLVDVCAAGTTRSASPRTGLNWHLRTVLRFGDVL